MDSTAETLELKNYDHTMPKRVWDEGGVEHIMPPLAKRKLPAPLARLFLLQHPKWIRPYEEVPMPEPQSNTDEIVYVANVTGSNLLPAQVVLERRVQGQPVFERIPNPLLEPMTLRHTIASPQKYWGPDEDRRCHSPLKRNLEFEPLRRRALPRSIADTIVRRDAMQEPHLVGKIVSCPPPVPGEPNESWPLDEIRLYAAVVDSEFFTDKRMSESFPAEAACLDEFHAPSRAVVENTKQQLLDALFPRLIDDRFSKPTPEAFARIKAKMAEKLAAEGTTDPES